MFSRSSTIDVCLSVRRLTRAMEREDVDAKMEAILQTLQACASSVPRDAKHVIQRVV